MQLDKDDEEKLEKENANFSKPVADNMSVQRKTENFILAAIMLWKVASLIVITNTEGV